MILAAAVALMVGLWAGFGLARVGGGPGGGQARGMAGAPIRAAHAPRPGPVSIDGMAFVRLRIDTSTAQPKACLEFSQDLSSDPQIRYADYLALDPAANVAAEAVGDSLCLSGLPFEPD